MRGRWWFLWKWVLCLWMGFTPLFLSGCYDRKELEQQAFVTVLGIDEGPSGTIDCTFELATPSSPDGGSGSSSTKTPKRLVVRAHSLAEAVTVANASVERSLSFTHLTLIVFGQQLAEQGLGDLVQSLIRFREFRGTIMLAVGKGTAQDVIQAFQPMLEKSPSRAVESVALVGQEQGIIPVTYLHDFTRQLQSEHVGSLLPLFAINNAAKADPSGASQIAPDVQPQLNVGTLPRTGGNPVEWSGAGVFDSGKMIDTLNGEQFRDIKFLRGQIRRGLVTFQDPVQKQAHVGLKLHVEGPPTYRVNLANPVRIQVSVPVEADIETTESNVDYTQPTMRAKLEQSVSSQLSQEFKKVLLQVLVKDGADVIPVSDRIRKDFMTNQQFVSYPWEQRLKDADISVSAHLHIRRFGIQTVPLQERG